MARPTKPKDIKPKAVEEGAAPAEKAAGGGGEPRLDIKFIVSIVAISLISTAASIASAYFIVPLAMEGIIKDSVKAAMAQPAEGHGEEGGAHHAAKPNETIGMSLELDEFTVNLKSDPNVGGNQFLRTKMALSIKVPEAEYCDPAGGAASHATLPPLEGTVLGAAAPVPPLPENSKPDNAGTMLASGGGGAADPMAACQQAFNKSMSRYVPTMRDIINAALMKRTAGQLSTIEGQEALKDEIKEQVNGLMEDKYAVIRVNFSDFIIQY